MSVNDSAPRGMKVFLFIWVGQVISILGSGLSSFGLGVWIYAKTGQATPFALTVLFANIPRLLLGPLAGSLADRWNRKLLMIFGDTGSALTTLAILLLVLSNRLEVWHIYLLAFISSAFSTFQGPAYTASITMLVPKKDLTRASGMMQIASSVETLIGPALAGVLFGLIGFSGIILIDFITYFFAVGALLVVRIPQPTLVEEVFTDERRWLAALWSDIRFSWRYLWQRNGLFWLLWYFALVNFLLNISVVLLGPLVLSFGTAPMLGLVQTVSGLGMLAGSVLISAWGGPKRRIPAVIGFIALSSVGLFLIGLRANVIFPALGFFLLMFCLPMASAGSQALFQSKVAPGLQGRVFAMRNMISSSIMPIAFLLAGPLADRVFTPLLLENGPLAATPVGALLGVGEGRGIGLIFVIAGVLLLAVSAAAYASPKVRNLEEDLLDEVGQGGAPGEQLEPGAQPAASRAES